MTYFPGKIGGSVTVSGGTISIAGATASATTSVNSGTGSVALLASNANRKGAVIVNTDSNTLRVLYGTGTASATNYSAAILSSGYLEVPYGYTGAIFGIWDADGSGAAIMTEMT